MKYGLISALAKEFGSIEAGLHVIAGKLVKIATDDNHPKQLKAIQELTDRMDGKVVQQVTGMNGEAITTILMPAIRLTQEQMLENKPMKSAEIIDNEEE